MRSFTRCLPLLDHLRDTPQLHQCSVVPEMEAGFGYFIRPWNTLSSLSVPGCHSSACRKKFALDRYFLGGITSSEVTKSDIPFTENLRALLSLCLSLFASNLSAANGNIEGGTIRQSSVISGFLFSYHIRSVPTIRLWCPLYCFPVTIRPMGFICTEFQSLSLSATRGDTGRQPPHLGHGFKEDSNKLPG